MPDGQGEAHRPAWMKEQAGQGLFVEAPQGAISFA
jgi:hypothetical protein